MAELPPIDPEQVMQRDAGRLIGQRRRLAGMDASDPKRAKQLEKFTADLRASMERRRRRTDTGYGGALTHQVALFLWR